MPLAAPVTTAIETMQVPAPQGGGGRGIATGVNASATGLYRSDDAGAKWTLVKGGHLPGEGAHTRGQRWKLRIARSPSRVNGHHGVPHAGTVQVALHLRRAVEGVVTRHEDEKA